ncbi:MAG: VWA domain-containing protein [Anaerolineae bacterium]
MIFSTPLALTLLTLIPIILYIGWPRQKHHRVREVISLVLRTFIVLLLVLTLAGTKAITAANKLAVIFLLDTSDSMGAKAQEAGLNFFRQALIEMSPDDQAGLILFGGNALVERPLSNVRDVGRIQSSPVKSNTDLEAAIRLALGLFPADAARRIVILSDGQSTLGNTESAAELAAATGVEISYVPYTPTDTPEVQVTGVSAPTTINAGQNFDLSLTVTSESETPATITILEAGAIIHQAEVNLRKGNNRYTLGLTGSGAGFTDFQVKVTPLSNDSFYQNNLLSTFSRVIGPPSVLLVSQSVDEVRYLQFALEQSGLIVEQSTPEKLPTGLVPLARYQSIILANVSATKLTPQSMRALQNYVRDFGGGLVVIGGPEAYGPGGYFRTPLEETLPLDSQVKDQKRLPQLTIAYVIDRSGSMDAIGPSGVSSIELAKEAIIRSIDLLQSNDRAGIVSFDSSGYWIANIQDVRDRLALQRLVGTLRASGGTDILAGLNLVAGSIVSDPSARKHIILLTDGGADPTGLVDLSKRLNEDYQVTTSIIAIGGGPQFLQQMAAAGGGNYHEVLTVDQIPSIFTQETVLATRSYILENPFIPSLSSTSPIVNGITSAPSLLGYIATSPKQTAEIILRGPEPYRDPILAAWQYGLGRSVAFTSDATARWGTNWISWENFVRFWDQTVRWTITEGTNNNLETHVEIDGAYAKLVVDARDNQGNFLNGLDLRLSVIDPTEQADRINLQQVAPGRYEARFKPDIEGSYFLAVRGEATTNGQAIEVDATSGWVMSYSAEYDRTKQNDGDQLLVHLAELTGGQNLTNQVEGIFSHNLTAVTTGTPIWPVLTLMALLLLPFDIAVRRLIVTRTDIQRFQQAIWGSRRNETTSERISSLMGAKLRGRQRAELNAGVSLTSKPYTTQKNTLSQAVSPNPMPQTELKNEPLSLSNTPDGNVAGQLLKKRKDRAIK